MPRRVILLALWVVATAAATGISWRGVRLVTASVIDSHTAIPERVVTAAVAKPLHPATTTLPGAPTHPPTSRGTGSPPSTTTAATQPRARGATPPAPAAATPARSTGTGVPGSEAPAGAGESGAAGGHQATAGSATSAGDGSSGAHAGDGGGTTAGSGHNGGGGGSGSSSDGSARGDGVPSGSGSSGGPNGSDGGNHGQSGGSQTGPSVNDPTATYAAAGGEITVACHNQDIRLVSATPNDGYKLIVTDPGPDHVDVTFANNQDAQSGPSHQDTSHDQLSAACVAGQPQQTQSAD